MDQHRITALRRSLISMPSRRDVLRGLTGVGLGLGSRLWPQEPAAKGKRKRKDKKKKAKPNAFGCLSVGKTCKKAEQCCSGICDGKKSKRKCRAHDTGTCDQDVAGVCQTGTPIATACNNRNDCACFRTTAGSSVCGELFCGREGCSDCADCQRDADCVALGFPSGAACAPVSSGACAGFCPEGMACVAPCGPEPPPPSEP
jgi:hypothetical protein